MDRPLTISVRDGLLVIEIGTKTLQGAFERSERNNLYNNSTGEYEQQMKVVDELKFAEEIVRELCDEQEDGTTPVHLLIDKAFESAVGNGCEGVEEVFFAA